MAIARKDLVQNGTPHSFSFFPAVLEAKLKSDLRAYDKNNPSTWPLITSALLKRHLGGDYTGRQDLPSYVAYDTVIMGKYLTKHHEKLSQAGDMLHSRYPCNFTQIDTLKQQVGMSTVQQIVFARGRKLAQRTETAEKKDFNMAARPNTQSARASSKPAAACETNPFTRAPCIECKNQVAELQELLSQKEAELKKEVTRSAKWRRSFQAADAESETARDRAASTEEEHKDLIKQRDALQTCCEKLKVENERLDRGNKRARVETEDSEEKFLDDMIRAIRRARFG